MIAPRWNCGRYGDSPEVTIVGQTDLVFPYIPSHMHHTGNSPLSHLGLFT